MLQYILLSEVRINDDLRRNFPGFRISLEDLFEPNNPFMSKSKEEAIRNYSCGYYIREVLKKENFRISFSASEILPVAFNVREIEKLSDLCNYGKVSKGIKDLKKMGIINFEQFVYARKVVDPFSGGEVEKVKQKRAAFYINDFESMMSGLRKYALTEGFWKRNLGERIRKQLFPIKDCLNEIARESKEVYEIAKRWYKKKGSFEGLLEEEFLII